MAKKTKSQKETYKCAVPSCPLYIMNGKMMCKLHWSELPARLQLQLFNSYTTGQFNNEVLMNSEWKVAAKEAVETVKLFEGSFS